MLCLQCNYCCFASRMLFFCVCLFCWLVTSHGEIDVISFIEFVSHALITVCERLVTEMREWRKKRQNHCERRIELRDLILFLAEFCQSQLFMFFSSSFHVIVIVFIWNQFSETRWLPNRRKYLFSSCYRQVMPIWHIWSVIISQIDSRI